MDVPKEKKDTAEKEFVSFPDVAADVINALLYHGKNTVNSDNLLPEPTETFYSGKAGLKNLIANQSCVDGKMLLRKAGYTGGAYRDQYEGKFMPLCV